MTNSESNIFQSKFKSAFDDFINTHKQEITDALGMETVDVVYGGFHASGGDSPKVELTFTATHKSRGFFGFVYNFELDFNGAGVLLFDASKKEYLYKVLGMQGNFATEELIAPFIEYAFNRWPEYYIKNLTEKQLNLLFSYNYLKSDSLLENTLIKFLNTFKSPYLLPEEVRKTFLF